MSLSISSLNKSFGEKVIFLNFSYNFDERGIYALMGDSGSGKTTLLRIISGLDRDFDGEVFGGGPSSVSVCFQEHRLFGQISALDNILEVSFKSIPSEAEKKEVKEMLFSLGFSEADLQLFPGELSGGMKQRIALVRAIMKKAPILLLDEPTKELDSDLAKRVNDLIKKEAENRLVIISTHSQPDVEYLGAKVIEINK